MANVTWKLPDGGEIKADIEDGINMMEAAVAHNVPGVVGECGGNLSCATCHIFVAQEWAQKIDSMGDFEDVMLDATEEERRDTSRLSCQIIASSELDGLQLEVPTN